MSPSERFAELIQRSVDPRDGGAPAVANDQCVFEAAGRILHLGLAPHRDELALSTMVYATDNESSLIEPELVAGFNAYHLFHGGYRLSLDPRTRCLYVSATRSLGSVEHSGLGPFIDDFVSRCISCTRWYVENIRRLALEFAKENDAILE